MTTKSVGYIYDHNMGLHASPSYHVERPERIYAIHNSFLTAGIVPLLTKIPSETATDEELLLAHTNKYVHGVLPAGATGGSGDMYLNAHTINAAKLAAGSTLSLVKAVLTDQITSGFAIVRPPGHHACASKCSGFCFYNNVAIAARYAAKRGKRVLIVDIDVHYGDGTHSLLKEWKDPNIYYYSIHRWDDGNFYPGGAAAKSCVTNNVVMDGFNGSKGDDYYLKVFRELFKPHALKVRPDIILVSAGFDAAIGDPLGQCYVTPRGYYEMINILKGICPKIALVLEGGYSLEALATSSLACMQSLLDIPLDISKVVNLYNDAE